jgi:hypothetical protein
MSRIQIDDLPNDVELTQEEQKAACGGWSWGESTFATSPPHRQASAIRDGTSNTFMIGETSIAIEGPPQ